VLKYHAQVPRGSRQHKTRRTSLVLSLSTSISPSTSISLSISLSTRRRRSVSELSTTTFSRLDDDEVFQCSMWSQLGVLGSQVVEAVFVSEDQATEYSEGRGVGGTVGAEDISEGRGVETVGALMEGNDVKALILKRMGIAKDEVDARLISLHHKRELNGTADRAAASPSDSFDRSSSGKSPTLTKKDLEDFERAEAEAKNGTPSQTGTPFKAFRPAVLNPSAPPRTPRTPPARQLPKATPAPPPTPAAESHDEVEAHTQPQHLSNWSEEMEAEDTIPPAEGTTEGSGVEGAVGATGKSEGSGVEGAVGAEGHGISEGSGGEGAGGAVADDVWPEPR
jgi:hypothetical protein